MLLQVARYLGVAPWELLDRPAVWWRWGLDAMTAESKARDDVRKRLQTKRGQR